MNAMNDVATLMVTVTTGRKSGTPEIETVGRLDAFANVCSVKRNEFYAAEREGIRLAIAVYVNVDDFEAAAVMVNEKKKFPNQAELDGKVYNIYRTYRESDTKMELLLQEAE